MKILLLTKNVEHVGEAIIPDFDEPPDIIFWGERAFRYSDAMTDENHNYTYEYTEAFAYTLVGVVT